MLDSWKNHNYEVRLTEDASPTLRWLEGNYESMHHSGGALTETLYIYGEPLKKVFKEGGRRIFSLGLGLGYNECLVAKLCLQMGISDLFLVSFEKDPFLTENFMHFLFDQKLSDEISHIYQQVLEGICDISPTTTVPELKSFLVKMFEQKKWIIEGVLRAGMKLPDSISCYLYDAFSSKTSPELWSQDFLSDLLTKSAAKNCIFTTYACTGSLKRSLKSAGFNLQERVGFKGKRDSTLAIRGFN